MILLFLIVTAEAFLRENVSNVFESGPNRSIYVKAVFIPRSADDFNSITEAREWAQKLIVSPNSEVDDEESDFITKLQQEKRKILESIVQQANSERSNNVTAKISVPQTSISSRQRPRVLVIHDAPCKNI